MAGRSSVEFDLRCDSRIRVCETIAVCAKCARSSLAAREWMRSEGGLTSGWNDERESLLNRATISAPKLYQVRETATGTNFVFEHVYFGKNGDRYIARD